MGGDADDESRQTISAAQLLSMGSCSAEEIGHIRLIVAWGNAFPAGINGLSAMLEKGVELAAALQHYRSVRDQAATTTAVAPFLQKQKRAQRQGGRCAGISPGLA